MKYCPKCQIAHAKPGKFCSRTCANSRIHSKETKALVSKKLKHPRIESRCVECGKIFQQSKASNSQKACSKSCSAKYTNRIRLATGDFFSIESRKRLSETRKHLFSIGSLSNSGGNTQWIPYKNIKVQGSYEYRTCIILDSWKELGYIDSWEYTNDRITYTNSVGQSATYLLDFKVKYHGKVSYIETKGYIRENDQLKWEAAEYLGIPLKIWFNEDICMAEKCDNIADVVSALS